MKRMGWGVAVAMVLFAFHASPLGAQPDQITLNHVEAYGKKQRAPVAFPHLRHIEADLGCKDCHHRYEQGRNILEESDLEEGKPGIRCAECHFSQARLGLRDAFHRQCVDCHGKTEKAEKKSGPRLCGTCHPWR